MLKNNLNTKICKAIEIIVDKKLEKLSFNTTVTAHIIRPIKDNCYEIEYQGISTRAYSISLDLKYQTDDNVYVLLLNNNRSNYNKIILSKIYKEV